MKSEKGQALILIALGMVAMLALVALAVDGGMAFAERRSSQNAVDNAALAAAYSIINSGENTATTRAQAQAAAGVIGDSNGFSGLADNVSFDAPEPIEACGGNASDPNGVDISVTLSTSTETSFGGIVGADSIDSTVNAKTRVCFPRVGSLFWGNAVVALDPNGNNQGSSFYAAGGNDWTVIGGGIMSNAGAEIRGNTNVTAPSIVAVTNPEGFDDIDSISTMPAMPYPPENVDWPEAPLCNGTAQKSGNTYSPHNSDTQWTGNVISQSDWLAGGTFNPGLYCVTISGTQNVHNLIQGNGVTFYIQGSSYKIQYNGGGGISTTAPTEGPYKGVAIFGPLSTTGMTNREFNLRGNGSLGLVGSILLPSSICDVRANSLTEALRSQLVCYQVTSGGGAGAIVNYNSEENYLVPIHPVLELLE